MTPKEKADEFVEKYQKLRKIGKTLAIYCAIICVNEIIKEICKSSENINPKYQDEKIEFWQNVKQHLEEMK